MFARPDTSGEVRLQQLLRSKEIFRTRPEVARTVVCFRSAGNLRALKDWECSHVVCDREPDVLAAAADVAGIGSSLSEANAAAAAPTTRVLLQDNRAELVLS